MTIKIKRLYIVKDGKEESIRGRDSHKSKVVKLQGDLAVSLTLGNLIASSEVDISTISEILQEELYSVLNKIEDELNGVNLKNGELLEKENKLYKEDTKILNKKEIVLSKKDVEKFLKSTASFYKPIENENLVINISINKDGLDIKKIADTIMKQLNKINNTEL